MLNYQLLFVYVFPGLSDWPEAACVCYKSNDNPHVPGQCEIFYTEITCFLWKFVFILSSLYENGGKDNTRGWTSSTNNFAQINERTIGRLCILANTKARTSIIMSEYLTLCFCFVNVLLVLHIFILCSQITEEILMINLKTINHNYFQFTRRNGKPLVADIFHSDILCNLLSREGVN